MEDFFNLFYEISNEDRYSILVYLQGKTSTITELSKQRGVSTQEISRHTARLTNIGLIHKEPEGLFALTSYGELVLMLVEGFQFISKHREHFCAHSITQIPQEYVERIGELSGSNDSKNVMSFLHYLNQMIIEAEEYVWLCVNQYPITATKPIQEALKRGIRFKVIEPQDILSKPDLDLESLEETEALAGTRRLPLGQQKILDRVNVFLALTESKCAVAFPNRGSQFDYIGFTSKDDKARKWCKDLFEILWSRSR